MKVTITAQWLVFHDLQMNEDFKEQVKEYITKHELYSLNENGKLQVNGKAPELYQMLVELTDEFDIVLI